MSVISRGGRRFKHGLWNTRVYRTWSGMHTRCNNSKGHNYRYYGARGIRVCEEWSEFTRFYDWAIANGYRDDLTIDRINNEGNYEPDNCRWIPPAAQSKNRRSVTSLVAFGEQKSLTEWAADPRCMVSRKTIMKNLRRGWNPEKALTTFYSDEEPLKCFGRYRNGSTAGKAAAPYR